MKNEKCLSCNTTIIYTSEQLIEIGFGFLGEAGQLCFYCCSELVEEEQRNDETVLMYRDSSFIENHILKIKK